jgi:hypothetical protein
MMATELKNDKGKETKVSPEVRLRIREDIDRDEY